jgi:Lrp/AsnC family transcriptional regulator for asnA, asnC and gidA
MKLSKNDWAILRLLMEDARTPYTRVGEQVGVSDAAVHQRVSKMVEEGVILRFTVEVDPGVLGRNVFGFVLVEVQPGLLEEVAGGLVDDERVLEVYETHSPTDLLVKVAAEDLDEMRGVMMSIRALEGVTGTELATSYKRWK